jgi:hypothetical protein
LQPAGGAPVEPTEALAARLGGQDAGPPGFPDTAGPSGQGGACAITAKSRAG